MHVSRAGAALILAPLPALIACILAACGAPAPGGRPFDSSPASPSSPPDVDALSPDRLRILPLTRLSREPAPPTRAAGDAPATPTGGTAADLHLIVHLELKDRFGHATKALGRLRIELYRPASDEPGSSLVETQDQVWELDLTDPDRNALLYDDLVTRSYALRLGGVPDWVVRWSAGESREPWVTLKATFLALDCAARERRLEAVYRMLR